MTWNLERTGAPTYQRRYEQEAKRGLLYAGVYAPQHKHDTLRSLACVSVSPAAVRNRRDFLDFEAVAESLSFLSSENESTCATAGFEVPYVRLGVRPGIQ